MENYHGIVSAALLTFSPDASVSKQKDTSRVVTSAAYLLFYRRRSAEPLGGPKFQEIFERYNDQTAADEDMSDSGEGRRLGQGSSRRGSPSALTGAGLTLPHGNRGLARLADDNGSELPSYQVSGHGDGDDDTDMGAQLSWSNQGTLHNSIEGDGEDEGIGLSDFDAAGMAGMTSVIGPSNWSFDNLNNNSKAGSLATDDDVDIASDVAQNDGESLAGNSAAGIDDVFDTGDMVHMLRDGAGPRHGDEPGLDYSEPPEPVMPPEMDAYDLPPPSPSAEEQVAMSQIAVDAWEAKHARQQREMQENMMQRGQQVHSVPPALGLGDDDDGASDRVAEIHVDGEEKKVGGA